MDFFFFIREKDSRSQAQIESSPAFMLEGESAHARGPKSIVVTTGKLTQASFARPPVDHSTSTHDRREATSRRRPGVDFSQTPLFPRLHPQSGRGTRMAYRSMLATTESVADTTPMKNNVNTTQFSAPFGIRLLLADDLPSIRDSLSRLLRRQGYNVALAGNGLEAVERVSTEHFDLVLLDLSMPELNGWEALKRIVALQPGLPVVIITAHSHQRSWVEPSGAWALLEKPLDIPLLLGTIRELTEQPQPNCAAGEPVGKARFYHYPSATSQTLSGLQSKSGINE